MMDWRIGRLVRTVVTSGRSASGAGFNVLPQPNRVGISFSFSVALQIETDPTAEGMLDVGINIDGVVIDHLTAYIPTRMYTLLSHGDMTTRGFLVAEIGLGVSVSVTEWFLPENVLADSIKNFESEYGKWFK